MVGQERAGLVLEQPAPVLGVPGTGVGVLRSLAEPATLTPAALARKDPMMARRDDPDDPCRRLEPVTPAGVEERVRARLDDQLGYYNRRARANQRSYRSIKIAQLIAAALVPVVAGLGTSAWVTGGLGSAIVVMEGIQQLYQFQEHWIAYRSTWEALRREQHLYNAGAGDYATAANPALLLAERVEELIAREHGRWVSVQQATTRGPPRPGDQR
jgi:hypothetical protein